ncbi:response regulator [Gryllotalpicola protaetiae]|uniref:DNA-binding response regulator n=1 Tax=Gryllotalpicola protaetiae TaxID=2419771 RepID=A0A387BKI7_9MICO|nr:response regulator transcription factor [Gryllotalpicola protaetiae]AYG04393.1 DNA-binding response regulator [Gryllotalpicola protaetiae]
MTRLVIADDQGMVRAGFAALLSAQSDLEVVGQAADGAEAVRLALALVPDVVLMDVRMPVMNGIDATAAIAAAGIPTRVLMLTTFDIDDYVFQALQAGASGFLLKDALPAELVDAVRVVAAGEGLLSPRLTRLVIEQFARGAGSGQASAASPDVSDARPELAELTQRENEILVLVAQGLTNGEIARSLFLAEQTVKTHVSRIFTKLGLRDRAQAVILAYERGLVRPGA